MVWPVTIRDNMNEIVTLGIGLAVGLWCADTIVRRTRDENKEIKLKYLALLGQLAAIRAARVTEAKEKV